MKTLDSFFGNMPINPNYTKNHERQMETKIFNKNESKTANLIIIFSIPIDGSARARAR